MVNFSFRLFSLVFITLLINLSVSAESLREYHQRQCTEGNVESCQRAEAMLEGERHAERIVELGDSFAITVDRLTAEEGNKPILKKAYPLVLNDYFEKEAETIESILEIAPKEYRDFYFSKIIELAEKNELEKYLKPEFYEQFINENPFPRSKKHSEGLTQMLS